MKPGDEVVTAGNVGAYYTPDPERWGPKFDLLVDKGSEAVVVGEHPSMPGWWIVNVLNMRTGNCWAPVEAHHVR